MSDLIPFATTDFRGEQREFGFVARDLQYPTLIIGATGQGKSVAMENIAVDRIRSGCCVMFLDPHGDSARRVLEYVPKWRVDNTIYFRPSDIEYPIGLNLLEDINADARHLVVSAIVSTFKSLWEPFFLHVQEQLLTMATASLLDTGGAYTLLHIPQLLTDEKFRADVVKRLSDPMLIQFWKNDFDARKPEYRAEALAPILNKLAYFYMSPVIRNVIGQQKPKFSLETVIDKNQIFIADLSGIGRQEAVLLYNLIVTKTVLIASNLPEAKRKEIYSFSDEVGLLQGHILKVILSEARKLKIRSLFACQYSAQLGDLLPAFFGNVGNYVIFRLGAEDAEVFAPHVAPEFEAIDLQSLKAYQAIVRISVNGQITRPFNALTLPPLEKGSNENRSKHIIRNSRRRFAMRRGSFTP